MRTRQTMCHSGWCTRTPSHSERFPFPLVCELHIGLMWWLTEERQQSRFEKSLTFGWCNDGLQVASSLQVHPGSDQAVLIECQSRFCCCILVYSLCSCCLVSAGLGSAADMLDCLTLLLSYWLCRQCCSPLSTFPCSSCFEVFESDCVCESLRVSQSVNATTD